MIDFNLLLQSVHYQNRFGITTMKNKDDTRATYRHKLCDLRMQQILLVQKTKRVNQLKGEMNKVSVNTPSKSKVAGNVRSNGSHAEQREKAMMENDLKQAADTINSNFLGISNGLQVNSDTFDLNTQTVEDEMKAENVSDFQELVYHFQQFTGTWTDSSPEESADDPIPRPISPGKKFKPKQSASASPVKRRAEEEKATHSTSGEDPHEPITPSPTSPRVRLPYNQKRNKQVSPVRHQSSKALIERSRSISVFSDEDQEPPVTDRKEEIDHTTEDQSTLPIHLTSFPSRIIHHNLPLIQEEIRWELRLPRSLEMADSKLFFFQNILWRLTFGVNNLSNDYYYFFLAPAEKLKSFVALKVDFIIHPPAPSSHTALNTTTYATNTVIPSPRLPSDPAAAAAAAASRRRMYPGARSPGTASSHHQHDRMIWPKAREVYLRKARENFSFPTEYIVSRGYERFITKEDLLGYLTTESPEEKAQINPLPPSHLTTTATNNNNGGMKLPVSSPSLQLSQYLYLTLAVVISTNLGPKGELIGCLNL